jgi:hypothetical protein
MAIKNMSEPKATRRMGGKHPVMKYPTIDVFVLRVGFVFSHSSSKVAKHPKGSKKRMWRSGSA